MRVCVPVSFWYMYRTTTCLQQPVCRCDEHREFYVLQVGKMADLVLWDPAFFGAKPEMIIKGGQIAWAQMGESVCWD